MTKKLPKVNVTTTMETATTNIIEITGPLLVEMLIGLGYAVPRNAEVYVDVPGGADWSNTPLDVDGETPVKVRWRTNNVETKET